MNSENGAAVPNDKDYMINILLGVFLFKWLLMQYTKNWLLICSRGYVPYSSYICSSDRQDVELSDLYTSNSICFQVKCPPGLKILYTDNPPPPCLCGGHGPAAASPPWLITAVTPE